MHGIPASGPSEAEVTHYFDQQRQVPPGCHVDGFPGLVPRGSWYRDGQSCAAPLYPCAVQSLLVRTRSIGAGDSHRQLQLFGDQQSDDGAYCGIAFEGSCSCNVLESSGDGHWRQADASGGGSGNS